MVREPVAGSQRRQPWRLQGVVGLPVNCGFQLALDVVAPLYAGACACIRRTAASRDDSVDIAACTAFQVAPRGGISALDGNRKSCKNTGEADRSRRSAGTTILQNLVRA